MAEDAGKQEPSELDDFSDRLDSMRAEQEPKERSSSGSAWGRAMRASSDLFAGLLVGGLLGFGLDYWLNTSPWFLLVGFGIGFAAGLRNLSKSLK